MANKSLIWSAVIVSIVALAGAVYLVMGAPGLEKAVTGAMGGGTQTGDCVTITGVKEGVLQYENTSGTSAAECAALGGEWCPGGNLDACGFGEGWGRGGESNGESNSCCAIDSSGWCCQSEDEGGSNNLSDALKDAMNCLLRPSSCNDESDLGAQEMRNAFNDSIGCPSSTNLFCGQGFDPFDTFCLFNSTLCSQDWLPNNFFDLMDECQQNPSSTLCGGTGDMGNDFFDNVCVRYPDSKLCGGAGDSALDDFFDLGKICQENPEMAICGNYESTGSGQKKDDKSSGGDTSGNSGSKSGQANDKEETAQNLNNFFSEGRFSDYNFDGFDFSKAQNRLQIQFCFDNKYECMEFDSLDEMESFIGNFNREDQKKYFSGEGNMRDACIWDNVLNICLYRDSFSYGSTTFGFAVQHMEALFPWTRKGKN